VSTGGFGDVEVTTEPPKARTRPEPAPETPVQIVSKPSPAYTEEARALKVEGQVVLEVVFAASGEMRVVGVVEGLGHGLDESAIEAARKIEFKPARRDGKPVDHAAVVRIVFQLA
jgi:TonB family protein